MFSRGLQYIEDKKTWIHEKVFMFKPTPIDKMVTTQENRANVT